MIYFKNENLKVQNYEEVKRKIAEQIKSNRDVVDLKQIIGTKDINLLTEYLNVINISFRYAEIDLPLEIVAHIIESDPNMLDKWLPYVKERVIEKRYYTQVLQESLTLAFKKNDVALIKHLEKHGANINGLFKNNKGYVPALHNAISMKVSESVLKYLLNNLQNINAKTAALSTALHFAVAYENKQFIESFLSHAKFHAQKEMQNIYGETPLDIAIQIGCDEIITLLTDKDLKVIQQLPEYKTNSQHISQDVIILKLTKYLELQINKNPQKYFLPNELIKFNDANEDQKQEMMNVLIQENICKGMCHGFSFLFGKYLDETQSTDTYYDILHQFSSWNEDQKSLLQTNDRLISLGYNNLQDLFEQFINDLSWFYHQNNTVKKAMNYKNSVISSKYRDDRPFQYDFVKNKSSHISIDGPALEFEHSCGLTKEEFLEILDIFSDFSGFCLEISGSQHTTFIYIQGGNKFIYYDPNVHAKIKPLNSKELSDFLILYKYYLFDIDKEKFWIDISMYRYVQKNHPKPASIHIQKQPYQKSPNQFTPLHYAVLQNDVEKFKQLLLSNPNLIKQLDIHQQTPMARAIAFHRNECLQLLLPFYTAEEVPELLKKTFSAKNLEAYKILIREFDVNLTKTFSSDIFSSVYFGVWSPYLINFYKAAITIKKTINFNEITGGISGEINAYPLIMAIENNDAELLKFLLEEGVDILPYLNFLSLNKDCDMWRTAIDHLKKIDQSNQSQRDLFSYAQQNNNKEFLNFYSSQHNFFAASSTNTNMPTTENEHTPQNQIKK